jgi:predicted ATP-dependent endonuclease of OLD family
MKLMTVRVQQFKSVMDSDEFHIGDVTCLVGKNEAGKSTLLDALYRLNPVVDGKGLFDVVEDYPRSKVEDYQLEVEQKKRHPAVVVTARFQLDSSEMAGAKEQFSPDIFNSPIIEVSKGYAGNLFISANLNEHGVIQKLVNDAGLPADEIAPAKAIHTLAMLSKHLERRSRELQDKVAAAQAQAAKITDPQEKAKAVDDANKLAESQAAKQLHAKLAEYVKESLPIYLWHKYWADRFPKFLYFDEYYQMEGQLNIQKLKQREANKQLMDSDRPMLALIDLARLNLDQLISPQNTQALVNKLEGASNHLSEQVFRYWSQNKYLSIHFDIRPGLSGDPEGMRDGMNLWGNVHDSAHKATVRLGTRSRGFIWFFSFLAWFSQQRKLGHPLILLLDEPGLFLHASAQADLLRHIEQELKPHHQVIYTTHSPFMVDPQHFDRVRIVRDKSMESRSNDEALADDEQGTKVISDVLEADEGSLFPLQGALAYDITQTLFVGPNNLIVEGVSDMFYLESLSSALSRAQRESLSDKWTLCPVGGIDKVSTFISLFRNQKGLNLATLIDTQKSDQQKIENLFKSKLLKKKQVMTFADFTNTKEADFEDMVEPSFYLELVNAEYKTELTAPIAEASLTSQHPRILVRLDEYFKTNPLKTGHFNHYRPARYLAENIGPLSAKLSSDTLNRFEAAFKAINALLV